jgi:dTDP-4-dehydrorhamnose reductase
MLLITGSNGQLGAELKKMYTTSNAIFTDRQEFDVTSNILEIESFCEKNNKAGIINCSAYTSVDKAKRSKRIVP